MREGGADKRKKTERTRRDVLRGLAATGGLALTGITPALMYERSKREEREMAHRPDWIPQQNGESFLSIERKPRAYNTTAISGFRIGPGLNRYLGLPTKEIHGKDGNVFRYAEASGSDELDFKYELAQLWRRKLELIRGDEPAEEFGAHERGEGVVEAMQKIFETYTPPEPGHGPSVEDFTTYVDRVVGDTASKLDLTRVESHFKMGVQQKAAFERLATVIDGDLLLAYSMTELMPSHNGVENVRAYEFLLKNAGRGFLERIPALGDRLISFGPYQFTSIALESGLGRNGKHHLHGASVIDATQETRMLPPTVVSLHDDDHYRAAYLFALYNFVVLIKDLGEERSGQLLKHPVSLESAARDFVIAAHHRPANAVEAFKKLLQASKTQPTATLERFCLPDVGMYLKKSHANEQAIRTRVARR